MAMQDLSEYGLIWYGGPLAVILERKNHLKMRKIQKMREFFINEFGVFETDSETEYRYNKQPMSFYNSHGTIIPKSIVKKVNKLYQKGKFIQCRTELEKIYPKLKGMEFDDIYKVFSFIVKDTKHLAIDIDTEKFLPYYRAYNPISIKRLNEACQAGRKAIDSLNPTFPMPPMPLAVAVIIGIIALAFIQNAPKWIREARTYIEDLGKSVDEPLVSEPIAVEPIVNEPLSVEVGQFIIGIINHIGF